MREMNRNMIYKYVGHKRIIISYESLLIIEFISGDI